MSKESKTYEKSAPRVYIRTFGCQMNVRDSEFVAGLFLEKGFKLVGSAPQADIILFNTCSVREHAEERAIQNMLKLFCQREDKIYGIIGCMAQNLKGTLFKRLPKLNLVCGTGEIARLPDLVKEAGKDRVLAVANVDKPLPEPKPAYREKQSHAYVSIMRGCDNFCSYCIVPYVRGKERSRSVEDILRETENLARRGIKHITLLGQNVNSYKGLTRNANDAARAETCDFVRLLRLITGIEGITKISFMTSHPKDAGEKLLAAMRGLDKVAKHLHLPLQSGSDKILGLMRRGYTGEKYLEFTARARQIIPGLRLTTDIMVGFPGEAERDFNGTLKLMKEIKFDLAYIFKYSPRAGTEAAGMEDNVAEEVKERRHKILLDLQRGISNSRKKTNEKNACLCHN